MSAADRPNEILSDDANQVVSPAVEIDDASIVSSLPTPGPWATHPLGAAAGSSKNKAGKSRRETIEVLLVEDDQVDADLIKVFLGQGEESLNPEFKLHWVSTLADATEWLEKRGVDVILLDLNLPDTTGLDSLTSLRFRVRGIPIVVLTGEKDLELATQAIRNGAQDYVWKNEASGEHLSRALRFARERAQREHIETELVGAGFIQKSILSRTLPRVRGLELAARCEPAEVVAGDFYDFIRLDDGSLVMVLGDVSGKGLGPALLMAETRGMIRSVVQWESDPGLVLSRVNSLIFDDCVRGAFVIVFLAVLAPADHSVTYATAGHEGFLVDAQGHPKSRLANTDPPLGIQFSHRYGTGRVNSIRETDMVFACTDGVTEAYDAVANRFFGNARVFRTIREYGECTAEGILGGLFGTVREFRDFGQDDMTAVLARTTSA